MAEQREAGVGFIGKFAAESRLPSLDDSIRLKQERLRDGEAEGLRRLEVDRQLELRRLLDREISGLRAFQDPIDVYRGLLEQLRVIRVIGDESASFHVGALADHDGKLVLGRQLDRAALEGIGLAREP